jgi:hypothetical protein
MHVCPISKNATRCPWPWAHNSIRTMKAANQESGSGPLLSSTISTLPQPKLVAADGIRAASPPTTSMTELRSVSLFVTIVRAFLNNSEASLSLPNEVFLSDLEHTAILRCNCTFFNITEHASSWPGRQFSLSSGHSNFKFDRQRIFVFMRIVFSRIVLI